MYHEASFKYFDDVTFNKKAKSSIDEMFDKLEGNEEYLDFEGYLYLSQLVKDEYEIDKWIPLKRDPNLSFKIDKVDPKTHKILISFKNDSNNTEEKRSLTYDELKNLDSQYELFNERRKIIKKLLRLI
jgi:ribosomal protein S1